MLSNPGRSSITWVSFHGVGHLLADALPCVTHVPVHSVKSVPGPDPPEPVSFLERGLG